MKAQRLILISIYLFFFIGIANAQDYFQQEVNYSINVKLDDVKHELTADESIEYINNSPSTLSFIYMHLWPNAYKNNSTSLAKEKLATGDRDFYYAKDEDRGFIDSLDFKVNGKQVKWEYVKDSIDICKLYLNEPLQSGNKITISTPFHVKIPSGLFSRLGHIGQSYQITQWYPKPAVFDRKGWNYMPYLNQGEFYSEFGSFDVSITVPKNYVLGATGDLVNGENEIEWLNTKVRETELIENFNSTELNFPRSDSATKTLQYKQKNVHDFAWFCDKRYHVLKGEIITPHTKHKVTTWVMFTNAEGNLWKNSIQYMNDAIFYYSLWNGDYPYNHCTAVDGTISAGGGMEYPNITVIGSAANAFQLDVVITHEIGHNWFYGMLGSNEREHPWMDEGINSSNELRYVETKYPNQTFLDLPIVEKIFDLGRYKHKSEYHLAYLLSAAKNEDQAMETPSYEYTELNYGGDVYAKSALAFDYLKKYLGDKTYDAAMQKYFDEWRFKHPMPNDLKVVFEKETGKDLGWFFNDMINTTKKLDYKIAFTNVRSDGSWEIGVKNNGEIKGPVFIYGIKDKKIIGEVMYEGFDGKALLSFPPSDVDYFKIDDPENMPEINRNNNTIRTHGIFKKTESLKLQFLGSLDNPDKSQLYFTPVVGWNNYNKWMFGLAFYNSLIPQKRFEFEIMPMYSHTTKDLTGYGHVALNFFPEGNLFQKISMGGTAARYAYTNDPFDMNFNKLAPELNIEFKKIRLRSPFTHTLRYRNITILKDDFNYDLTLANYSAGTTISYLPTARTENYNDVTYKFSMRDAINPFNVSVDFQEGQKMMKASTTINYSYNFKKKNKGVDIRVFAGSFLGTKSIDAGPYRFRMSGWRGYHDYLYDNIYLGRSETDGVLANQFTENDGGFKFYSPNGQSGKWLAAINIKSSLGNLKLPVCVYADLGTCADDGINTEKFLYDAGLCLVLSKNIFEIYFPLLISKDMEAYKDANDLKYVETIRFTLNINLINPFNLVRGFKL